MRLPLPDIMVRWLSGWSRPAQAAAWQLPLIGLLALEISMVVMDGDDDDSTPEHEFVCPHT